MQNIELYIEGQRVELFKDETVSLTQTLKNAREVDKIFTEFTKTFSVPASKSNNKIFKHYYNFDIDNFFDARVKKPATIELNSYPFKEGKIKLEGVTLKDNKPYTYRITFFGNTVNLKDLVGEDKLNQLVSLNALNLDYDSTTIKSKLQLDPSVSGNDIITPLITSGASGTTSRLFYNSGGHGSDASGNLWYQNGHPEHGVLWSDLKYAIRIRKVVEAIGTQYGLTFSSDFFNSTNLAYNDLFMWLHRKKGKVESGSGTEFVDTVDGWSVATDVQSEMINTSTFKITNASNITGFLISFTNTSFLTGEAVVKRDGQTVAVQRINGAVLGNPALTIINLTSYVNLGSEYTVTLNYNVFSLNFSNIRWLMSYSTGSDVFDTGSYVAPAAFEFSITSQIPDIKVIDLLTGLFKMFNLVAFLDGSGTVVVKTLDSFYTGGNNYDISSFIDINTSDVNVALPYKEIVFAYKDNKTFLAAIHSQLFSYTWAKEDYTGGENLDGSIYKVELPFGHFKFERIKDVADSSNTDIQWGYCVDDNQESYIGSPFLFYPIKVTSTQYSISFRDIIGHSELTSYNVPSNSLALDPATSKENINFKNELNEYTASTDFTDTLFQKYYSNYITDIFNNKNRLTKVTAYLPLRILLNFTLADRFDINGQRYKINSIKTNLQDGKSEIELLNEL
tara:strand:+ start:1203 stop:3233 length:2031 start_codon:yes stop_codon:yes gene_type:complete